MYKHMTDCELNMIEERCNKTTQGPWRSFVEGRDHLSGSNFIMTGTVDNRGDDIELIGATIADQDFIACAKQDIPRLIEEVRALKQLIKVARVAKIGVTH